MDEHGPETDDGSERLLNWLMWHVGNYSEFPNSSIVGILCLWFVRPMRRDLQDWRPIVAIWAAIIFAFGFMLGYLVG